MTDHFLQSCRCGVYLPDTAEQPRDAACTCRECGQAYVISPVQQLSSIVWVLTSLINEPNVTYGYYNIKL